MDITNYLTECVTVRRPVVFLKYGDGEYCASMRFEGCNCDQDQYTDRLSQGLIDSFRYMVERTTNAYLGLWPDPVHQSYWESLTPRWVNSANYHTIIMDGHATQGKVNLLQAIRDSPLNKIMICNPLMVKAQSLLRLTHLYHVPFNNWVDVMLPSVIQGVTQLIQGVSQPTLELNQLISATACVTATRPAPAIIITAAGMGSKLLVAELHRRFPECLYLDFGSALDQLCTKKTSRGWEPNYEQQLFDCRHLIPADWDHPRYEYIYREAQSKVGLHLEGI